MSPMEMVQTVFSDPPLPLSEIIRAGTTRAKAQLPPVGGSPLRPLPEYPSRDGRKPYLLRDPAQADDTLWGSFQAQLRTRLLKRNEPPPPPPQPKTFTSSLAMPKVAPRSPSPTLPEEPQDWTGKVALALHNIMKRDHQSVHNVFRKFDTDGSNSLDSSEFICALVDLKIPESLGIPQKEIGGTLLQVFDTMDDDGNGVLSFKEINHYLRAGRHEIVLDEKLQVGAVAVQSDFQQTHRTRRKEEWKALERFGEMTVGTTSEVSIREMHAYFISEGYGDAFPKALMAILDVDISGTLSSEEWRKGVRALKGSELLMSMTDPVEPPSGENFKDLQTPKDVLPHVGYEKRRQGTTVYPEYEYQKGKMSRGCEIKPAEQRGTRLNQLRSVCAHISRRCDKERWVDADAERLSDDQVTMYDCVAYVIKPATRKKRNSLMEVISRGAQPPKWFASHWWGTSILSLLTCLERHARDHKMDPNQGTYWISAFALSHWTLDNPCTPDDPSKSALMKVIELCDGTVSIVDPDGGFFSRIWCVYEVGYSIQLSMKKEEEKSGTYFYDMYTPCSHRVAGELIERFDEDGKRDGMYDFYTGTSTVNLARAEMPPKAVEHRLAVGMTDGVCALDRDVQAKTVRESHFPSKVFQYPLQVRFQRCDASVESDKTYLMNVVAGVEPGEEGDGLWANAQPSHKDYHQMNADIRGNAAQMSLVRSVIEFCKGEPAMFEALCEGLRESTLTKIDLCFNQAAREGVSIGFKVFDKLLENLPVTIEHLVIELPPVIKNLPSGRLKHFPKLHRIDIVGSDAMETLPEDIVECYALQTLELTHLKALRELPKRLFDLRSLTTLNLTGCNAIKTMHARGVAKSKLETLVLQDCSGLMELPVTLGNNLVNLNFLSLRGCDNITELPSWVASMEKMGVTVQRPEGLR